MALYTQNLSQRRHNTLIKTVTVFTLLMATICCFATIEAKNLDLELQQQQYHHNHHHTHNRRLQRRDSTLKEGVTQHCNDVRGYFESIDIQLPQHFNEKGK